MARKFLYIFAAIIVLVMAGLLAMRYWAQELTELAFVPRAEFTPQPPLATNVYDDPKMWVSRPGLGANDPARWRPAGIEEDASAIGAAVFFVHPTSYLATEQWNAPLEDAEARTRANLFVRGMASPFNRSAEIWAPRYRQAAFGAFLTDAPEAQKAVEIAYGDVLKAFDYFTAHTGANRPIVLAGHSQGALMVMRLLKDRIARQAIAKRVAVAYVIGWPVSPEHDLPAMGLPACAAPDQAGCAVSWASFAEPAEPPEIRPGLPGATALDGQPRLGAPPLCTNPLTGTPGGEAPASANLGTLVPSEDLASGALVKGAVPARCDAGGLLLIGDPPKMGAYVLPGNNYHVYDIVLFWANLRADFARRVQAWKP